VNSGIWVMKLINALGMARQMAKDHIEQGDTVIDATAGRGRDTLLLSNLVGKTGRVFSFDIQEEAIASSKELFDKNKLFNNVTFILDNHEMMLKHIEEKVSFVMFNLGYLPGGDHSIGTEKESTINAISASLGLLGKNGFIVIVVYHGGDTGYEERDAVIRFAETLNQHEYIVRMSRFINQRGDPPILICIQKTC